MSSPDAFVPAPLPWWGRLWRITVCLLTSVVMLGFTIFSLEARGVIDEPRYEVPMVLDVFVLAPVLYVGLWWHRRFPLWLCVLVALLSGVSTMAMGPSTLLLLSVATRRRWRQTLPVAVAILVASVAYEYTYPQETTAPLWLSIGGYAIVTAALVAWGMYIGARRELVAQWRWRAETAEAEQARQAVLAAQTERGRIAREMHDVLAHRLSQVSLHAGVLSYRTDLTPEQVRAEAETIRAASTSALEDLRGILGVLRNTDDATAGAVSAPQPTLAALPDLVEEARSAGADVTLLDDRPDAPVPETIGRHAYRMAQEALTNARRHAPGAPVTVRLAGRPGDVLTLTIANGPSSTSVESPGAGLGLVGLRERAVIVGGSAEAAPTPDGGWLVDVRLPWATTKEAR